MRVSPPELVASPNAPGRVRLQAAVHYRNHLARPEHVWFEVDEQLKDQLSLSGNPWLVALLPLALTLKEDLEIAAPVDPLLLENAQKLQSLWTSWYPRLSPVTIRAERLPAAAASDQMTGLFFSGGVDSFYSVLHAGSTSAYTIDELVFIQGADILLSNARAFERASATIRHACQVMGMPVQIMATNLRSTRFRQLHWDQMGSGPLLGACGLALEARYRQLLISSTWAAADLHPLGSHPQADPLYSTATTSFIHYGDWADRIEKTEFVSRYPVALDHLRVCWESPSGDNCGQCLKCLRTMIVLEVIGKLESCPSFPSRQLDLAVIRRLYLGWEWRYFKNLIPYLRGKGRDDIADAIQAAFRRTARLNQWMFFGLVWRARMTFQDVPWARSWLAPVFMRLRRAATWINRRLPPWGNQPR